MFRESVRASELKDTDEDTLQNAAQETKSDQNYEKEAKRHEKE